jgi:hypothetical protein
MKKVPLVSLMQALLLVILTQAKRGGRISEAHNDDAPLRHASVCVAREALGRQRRPNAEVTPGRDSLPRSFSDACRLLQDDKSATHRS